MSKKEKPANRTVKMWQAVNEALTEEMERDESVVLFGEDVATAGGTFGESRGLRDRFGEARVRDTPISEQAIVGAATGAAMAGLRPVAEILYLDFLGIGSDQLLNQAAKIGYFSRGEQSVPMVVKSGVGTLQGMGAQHSQALEGMYAQVPGLKVCWPSAPNDAKGLMKAAIRDSGPVLFLESFALLRKRGPVDVEGDGIVQLGSANRVRAGEDITIVTWGTIRDAVEEAAAELEEQHRIAVDLIDLRTLYPWDRSTVFESVARTNRCMVVTEACKEFGPSAEIAAEVGEHCFDDLDAPVHRLASPRVPAPHFTEYDAQRIPSRTQITKDVIELVGARG